ncbi:MAG: TetR/AcrR family transcriptional regulator [Alphaproteobacteria bacterium]|nr:TetR/AcrR family transcriptional regulator [Alphaproteobacteria bacterium]
MRDGRTTKELIDRTALALFAEKGVKETTIRDIAETAGIAEGTMYRHYSGKEELAWRLFVENYTALGEALATEERRFATARDKIRAMVHYFCKAFTEDPDRFVYLFFTRHDHMLRLHPRQPNPYLVFRRVIRQAMNRGEIPKGDPDVATSMVLGVVLQVIDSRLLGGRIKRSIASLADDIAEGCWKAVA